MTAPPRKILGPTAHDVASARSLRRWLMALIIVLTFEGIARKLEIPGTNIPIFLLKDVIVLIIGVRLLRANRPPTIDFLWFSYLAILVLFLPLILSTAVHDPLLALYGAKEYLLYPLVTFAVFIGFHDQSLSEITRFFRWISLLIIPTVFVALVQLRLPPDHWLNLSVEGDVLAPFSAGGKLRVSSTFSFVAQYSAFLNAQLFMLVISLSRGQDLNKFWRIVYLGLVPLFIISNYVTGSRGAVIGCSVVIAIAWAFLMMKSQVRNSFRLFLISVALVVLVTVGHYLLPDEFAAYSAREEGQLIGMSGEIQSRVVEELFDWVGHVYSTPFFGNGLGLMSNGCDLFSDYAAHVRNTKGWTETDFASTLFEGGIYLVVIWYAFRFFVIAHAIRFFLADVHEELSLPASFCLANVVLLGCTTTLGIQPPLAIWFWLTVGTSMLLWWKCVGPKRDSTGLVLDPPAPGPKKVRGRSAYAERLHRGR